MGSRRRGEAHARGSLFRNDAGMKTRFLFHHCMKPFPFAEGAEVSLGWTFGAVFTLVVLGLLSFWPASRGHWSALLMAGPSVALGGFLTWSLVADSRPDQAMPDLWFLFPAPLAVGVVAILVWWAVRYAESESE